VKIHCINKVVLYYCEKYTSFQETQLLTNIMLHKGLFLIALQSGIAMSQMKMKVPDNGGADGAHAEKICKGTRGKDGTTLQAGSSLAVKLEGSVYHEGGGCQFGISYDDGKSFTILLTTDESCPKKQDWSVPIPAEAPSCDKCVFAWGWVPRVSGGPEYFMNCAEVKIKGTATGSGLNGPKMEIYNMDGYPKWWNDMPNGRTTGLTKKYGEYKYGSASGGKADASNATAASPPAASEASSSTQATTANNPNAVAATTNTNVQSNESCFDAAPGTSGSASPPAGTSASPPATPDAAPAGTSASTPPAAPNSAPAGTPASTPPATPDAAPAGTSASTPPATPDTAPAGTPSPAPPADPNTNVQQPPPPVAPSTGADTNTKAVDTTQGTTSTTTTTTGTPPSSGNQDTNSSTIANTNTGANNLASVYGEFNGASAQELMQRAVNYQLQVIASQREREQQQIQSQKDALLKLAQR
jgi:hypothetical protein